MCRDGLTDDFNEPRKYRLPNGSVVQPHGYFVLAEPSFAGADGSDFSFDAGGEEIYLFSADAAGNLTGWLHGFEYGAASRGGSLGRHVASTGVETFVIQSSASPGLANPGPRVGPVVVSEIHCEPEPLAVGGHNNTNDEFIELRNITGQPVSLFDPAAVANSWRLRGQVDFNFPPGTVVPAGGSVVLVGFDPRAYPWAAAAFRGHFGIDEQAVLLGPWSAI
jgi:hypothetical protein